MMRVLAVLDVRGGVVVRGRAGRRADYRPVSGPLTPSARPLDVARLFRERWGLDELYVADLDAIGGDKPDLPTYQALVADGFRLWVDAGIRVAGETEVLAAAGVVRVILGLETLAGPEELSAAATLLGDRAVFSLDLHAGRPLTRADWGSTDPWQLATLAIACGLRRVLVLDLARVGESTGTGTEELCGRLVTTYPTLEVSAGGGIRDGKDLIRLRDLGISAVLVASALHDGTLTREQIQMTR